MVFVLRPSYAICDIYHGLGDVGGFVMISLFWPIWCNSLEKKNGSANHSSLGSRQRKQNTYVCTSLIHRHQSMHFLHTNHFNFHMAVIRISPQKVNVSLFFIKSVNIIKKTLNLFTCHFPSIILYVFNFYCSLEGVRLQARAMSVTL